MIHHSLPRVQNKGFHGSLVIGRWRAIHASGELIGAGTSERLEPKVMDLLFMLASRPNKVVSKQEILDRLWPALVVGEDTLARSISKLRKALGDEAKLPRFIQTLPKRGYRLIVDARIEQDGEPDRKEQELGADGTSPRRLETNGIRATSQAMAERANDFYYQYSRIDNESAIELYERIIATDPEFVAAYSGLANALVQRAVRWPHEPGGGAPEFTTLRDALNAGYLRSPGANQSLQRAQELAELAVRFAPDDAASHKSLGFVFSARGDFENALAAYNRAVALDENAWGPLFNIGDNLDILGRNDEALVYFEAAYAAMTRAYDKQAARIRPWYADIAVMIGDRYRLRGDLKQAESFFRRVLEYAPFHRGAIKRLATALSEAGNLQAARNLYARLELRIGRCEENALTLSAAT